jgi:REP element-mobilizing transposase RayT
VIDKMERRYRRSLRLKNYDYSSSGSYFVTICTRQREYILGEIVDGEMVLNETGQIIRRWYYELMKKFRDIQCDEYIVMPNYFHCIIITVGADLCVYPENIKKGEHIGFAPT